MDTTQHHASIFEQEDGDWEPQKRRHQTSSEEDEEWSSPFEQSISDLAFDVQSFAESDEDVFEDDDATASETDTSSDTDDDDSLGSLSPSDEESCCSLYDDEQDLTCLKAYQKDFAGERKVRFTFVEIREYSSTLGDHPCAQLCPITLDWMHTRGYKRDIDSYENSRFFLRRSYPQKLTASQRRNRIRMTSRLSKQGLRDLELEVAMHRLEDSMSDMSQCWGDIDGQAASRGSAMDSIEP